MKRIFELDFAAMRAWLEAKNPTEVVGIAVEAKSCPVANYLRETTIPNIYSIFYSIEYTTEQGGYTAGENVSEKTVSLLEALDRSVLYKPTRSGRRDITAENCLTVLNSVEKRYD